MRGDRRDLGLLAALLVALGLFAWGSPWFLTAENLHALCRHLAEIGLVACAMTFVIASGGIDLSVGSLLGLCGLVFGAAWPAWGAGPAALLALGAGAAAGALNGALVAAARLPPLAVTLATMGLFRGLAMGASQGQPVSTLPAGFAQLGQGTLVGVPTQLWPWLAAVAVSVVAARRLAWGRQVHALGDNPEAARFAAIPVARLRLGLYVLSGLASALAGLVYTSRVATARADAGLGFELTVITCVVLGGTPIAGGRPRVVGTLLGVLFLGVLRNGLTLQGVTTITQALVVGALLVAAAIVNERLGAARGRGAARAERA